MAQQQVVEYKDELYKWDEDLKQYLCLHQNAYIERACCSGYDSEGNLDCDCGGLDQLICDNPDCTGINHKDRERLLNELDRSYEYEED